MVPANCRTLPIRNNVDASTGYVLGVDLGGTKTTIVASTGLGSIAVPVCRLTTGKGRPLEASWLVASVRRFIATAGLDPGLLKAIGIGVPGSVDIETGEVFLAPNLGWSSKYPLRAHLETALGVPVLMDNDVNMAAIGEMSFGAARSVKNFVFVAVGTGIGAGIVVDRRLYRGSHWCAGEIGYMAVSDSCLDGAYTDHGYMELIASGGGIAGVAREAGLHGLPEFDTCCEHEMAEAFRPDWPKGRMYL